MGARRPKGLSLHEAFAFYAPTELDPQLCWAWPLSKTKKGYGQLTHEGRPHLAHRVSWEIANNRTATPDQKVRHTCDNPPCVNPRHLILGTSLDNSRDMVERGRSSFGERNGRSKLTEDTVIEIRRLRSEGLFYIEISRLLKIPKVTVWYAVNRWSHLNEIGPLSLVEQLD